MSQSRKFLRKFIFIYSEKTTDLLKVTEWKPQENVQSMFIKITNKTMASEDVNMKCEILQTTILEHQQ